MSEPESLATFTSASSLGEADTRAKLIDPKLHSSGWTEDFIRREETAGEIQNVDGRAVRAIKGRVDYTLRLRVTEHSQPVAVAFIEAKAENNAPGTGLEQAKGYAAASKRHNVPFVFATNGHQFVEYDAFTQQTSSAKALAQFPTPAELRVRYENGKGFALDSEAAKPLLVPYPGGEATRRYYQDAAIRAVLEKVATGEKKALLSLATGAGKTFIAVNLLRRIADAGQLRRALFVCDRDELRTQALTAFGNIFGGDVAEVREVDGKNHARNARIHIATYQTLDIDSDEAAANFLTKHYPENAFSHIIIDECHRSAWGKWSLVLRRNAEAIQIGLTATPRELIESARVRAAATGSPECHAAAMADDAILADNLKYFGEPVYEYSLAQGIEDGYLAPPEIFTFDIFHDQKTTPERETPVAREDVAAKPLHDAHTGAPLTAAALEPRYAPSKLDERLLMPDRIAAMSRHLFEQLCQHGGPQQKTIVFCASDTHAERVTAELGNLYADWCAANGREPVASYAFRCTAKSGGGDLVADLRGSASSHFVACTVELLSTGVDVPCLRNIAFFQYLKSPIVFAQMLGRGTRIDIDSEKLMFRVWDYTDATRLLGEEFRVKPRPPGSGGGPVPPPAPPPVVVDQVQIHIADTGRWLTALAEGRQRRITVEEYREKIAARLMARATTLGAFRGLWVVPGERRSLLGEIVAGGLSPKALQMAEEALDFDLYDVLGEVGYGLARVTRAQRSFAFSWKQKPWLETMPTPAAAAVKALASQFGKGGTEALETPQIFTIPEVRKAGGLDALKLLGEPASVLHDTKVRLFAA